MSSLLLNVIVSAQNDSLPIIDIRKKITENSSLVIDFAGRTLFNPANKYKLYDYRMTDVKIGAEYEHQDEALVVQKGDGYVDAYLDINTYIPLKDYSFWGGVKYKNGERKNVRFNETSDYSLLYPYLMGDTIGGDMKYEVYYFSGGYAQKRGLWTWGAEADLRALQEYRGVDPRPKNTSTTLNISLGAALQLPFDYNLAFSLRGRKYKQTNELSFYNELGKPNVYHYTGLDTDYARFRGSNDQTHYKGHLFGADISFLPIDKSGFSANLSYDYFTFEKIIKNLNELPMAKASDRDVKAELVYLNSSHPTLSRGVKIDIQLLNRRGTENIFGDPANNNYQQIMTIDMYEHQVTNLSLSGFLEKKESNGIFWSLMPTLTYLDMEESYVNPKKTILYKHLVGTLSAGLNHSFGKFYLKTGIYIKYTHALDSKIDLGSQDFKNFLAPEIVHNYMIASKDNTQIGINPQIGYKLKNNYLIYLGAEWHYGRYTDNINACCSIVNIGAYF